MVLCVCSRALPPVKTVAHELHEVSTDPELLCIQAGTRNTPSPTNRWAHHPHVMPHVIAVSLELYHASNRSGPTDILIRLESAVWG